MINETLGKKHIRFNENVFEDLNKCAAHFWFVHRNRIILDIIKKYYKKSKLQLRILELGAGAGAICNYLKEKGYQVDASDVFQSALLHFENIVDYSFVFDIENDKVPNELKNSYDLVVLGDVLEHLNDPVSALEKAKSFLYYGGRILITLPALKELWSIYDVYCEHKKRYSKKDIEKELDLAGYFKYDVKYFMFIPAIILFFLRKIEDLFQNVKSMPWLKEFEINSFVNYCMNILMHIEYVLGRYIRYPFGSSIIAIAERIHAK